ncbi:unnamed protein product [Commensalibacter papalotli (ex Botero et al. 2024)]|uniref:Uncharacterized protein n=1 Tax=Commensalibacter papalotli (ex Botero et al. 2024) TaxID=2972766 RepID=A0ABM9HNX9_9PROT|nr:unnamed protein product [Commensalibacter papalotli (ex Botero et al. 2024)]
MQLFMLLKKLTKQPLIINKHYYPEHIRNYNNIEAKVIRIHISELQRNYDNT